jgi:hypothetical protein
MLGDQIPEKDSPFGFLTDDGEVLLAFFPEEDGIVVEAPVAGFKVSKEALLQLADAIYQRFKEFPKVKA